MTTSLLNTHFAKPDRSSPGTICRESELVSEHRQLIALIDAMPQFVAILNENRQIVGANKVLVELLGSGDPESVLGLRPGEAVQCVHSDETASGCGTSEACKECGAVLAILAAQSGKTVQNDCQISQGDGNALDLRINASPIMLSGDHFILFSALDIESEKRREVLERTFFHDIINSAGGMQGLAELLKETQNPDEAAELIQMLSQLTSELLSEIRAQRELLAAERWELQPEVETFESKKLLEEIMYLYQRHPVGEGKLVQLDDACVDLPTRSAKALLFRVVGNMAKNALEASTQGEIVTLGCDRDSDHLRFWVHNQKVIPRDIQLQIFNRSFSTKGTGRGIGTYSMKMLTERYLGGKVSFRSEEGAGTTFTARIRVKVDE